MARPRQWTDDQLRGAVATSSTWGEVVTKIGHADYGAERRVMQGHAMRLGLEVGHLPPFKPVAPRQPHDAKPVDRVRLASAIRESASWADVLRQMGFGQSGSTQHRFRVLAEELGLDTSHFRGQAWGSTPVNPVEIPFTRQPDPKHLRKAATALATAWFMERGYLVCVPTEPASYDIVVESDGGFVRVQVKSTSKRDPRGYYVVDIYRKTYNAGVPRSVTDPRARCTYTEQEIDVFFIVAASGARYLIPLTVTGSRASLTLDVKYAGFKV